MNKGCLYSLIAFVVVVLLGAGGTLYYLNEKEKQGPEIFDTEQAVIGNGFKGLGPLSYDPCAMLVDRSAESLAF